jgi:hypothetical protein
LVLGECFLTSKVDGSFKEEINMMKFKQSAKSNRYRPALLAALTLACGLITWDVATADPVRHGGIKTNPNLNSDQVVALHLLTTDDFRAPPVDHTSTGSIDKPTSCGRATFLKCKPQQ